MPKALRRLLLTLALLYFLPLVCLGVFQRFLVFGAAQSRHGILHTPAQAHLLWLRTQSGDRFDALYGYALRSDGSANPTYKRRPTLLFFSGKGAALAGETDLFQSLRRIDVNVLMPEYVGFGRSGGQESETSCFATARASYQFLRAQPDIDQKRLIVAGYSLGSGVAVDLAAHELQSRQPVAGLALFAAYTSMADMGHQEYPIYPAWLLRIILEYPFAGDAKMPQITCPVLLVHSRADKLIPYAMSDKLTVLAKGPVTRITITHAGHAEYFSTLETTVFPALKHFTEKTIDETKIHAH